MRVGPEGNPFPTAGTTERTVTIADVVLDGAVRVEGGAGWNAPEKQAESGFEYHSFVDVAPIEATVEAWIDTPTYDRLTNIRAAGEPFPASLDHLILDAAKLKELTAESKGEVRSHRRVTVELQEVRRSRHDEVELVVPTPDQILSTASDAIDPAIAFPQRQQTAHGPFQVDADSLSFGSP